MPPPLPKVALTVPDGWFNYHGWALGKGPAPKDPLRPQSALRPDSVRPTFVTFWDVASVYPTPCHWAGKPLVDPGPDVDGLASALSRQPLRNATTPTDVALAGFHGKYLQWSVPTNIAFDEKRRSKALFPRCDEKTFQSWTGSGWASDRYAQAPGQVDMLWILDVHGERLVVDASYLPEATAADRAELGRVVHSIRFEEGWFVKRLLSTFAAFAALLPATAALAGPNGTATARLIRVTSPVAPGARATLVARVVPARRCTITVRVKMHRVNARSLHPKHPVHGRVSWTWTVGARTPNGRWPIHVDCGSAGSFRTHFTVFGV